MPFLEMLSPEEFGAVREHFVRSGFGEKALRERLQVQPDRALDICVLSSRPAAKPKPEDALDALIHFFIVGESLLNADVQPLVPAAVWEALTRSHLIAADPADGQRSVATVALYPIRDLLIVSDRWNNPDHSPRAMFPDIVYPALTKSAKQFIDFTSYEPCEDFLELCAGTAPAALLASRTAKNIWATDIAERSIEFAKFNAALNGIHNVKFGLGDLYEPVEGQMFDRIAAAPSLRAGA